MSFAKRNSCAVEGSAVGSAGRHSPHEAAPCPAQARFWLEWGTSTGRNDEEHRIPEGRYTSQRRRAWSLSLHPPVRCRWDMRSV